MNKRVFLNIGQMIILNLIYILINVISLGFLIIPSSSTLFHFISKMRNDTYDPYDTFIPFFKLLIVNTKEMISIQVIFMIINIFCWFNIVNMDILTYPFFLKQTLLIMYIVIIVESILLIIVISYLKGNYIFKSKIDIIKMSIYLIHRHILQTLIIAFILIMTGYVLYSYSLFIALFGIFAFLFYLLDILYTPICRNYVVKRERGIENECENNKN